MTQPFSYQTTFILDKSHFSECYDESVPAPTFVVLYRKGAFLLLIGALLVMFSELNPYAAWFIFSLGLLEVVSSRYKKAWWVARQMLSKVAKAEVSLKIDADSVHISSFYNDNKMKFSDIERITHTDQGWLISHNSFRHYISNRCLNASAQDFLQAKVSQ
ncbi:YcxB family protein [Colwellia sp. MB02u-18]|uniref:YcxB family protein n=1 Tax=unclassified Colwellia TaxID=196834 RepID=UPI0015F538AF|nr:MULTISPECIES: YcxB family protein [unclassified Colwellia]MBA6223768.1 YcxB family protein [Colwellia sp. MB3u-45]MBA6268498.1 YcxB family protein [Colwellia sp. MB3u-43]MBA6319949.1 YcxB family protein [Colwellia sp. MB02u-19]MBA6324507.1 YcxB family protein [Colwellia sp. MB02u-18]MBA6330662.1 YcxB family protein [Colwellia sp. MB02u-12]